ncbi:MAG TPA: hypothetical protein VNO83_11450, partial [Pseudonocardia sp.]|nr:hypothetical protein [Pseudonocardia sp.]
MLTAEHAVAEPLSPEHVEMGHAEPDPGSAAALPPTAADGAEPSTDPAPVIGTLPRRVPRRGPRPGVDGEAGASVPGVLAFTRPATPPDNGPETDPAGPAIPRLGPTAFDPSPTGSSPVSSPPIDSSPVDSSPIGSSPVGSFPVDSSPVDSSPVDSSPVDSSPVDS